MKRETRSGKRARWWIWLLGSILAGAPIHGAGGSGRVVDAAKAGNFAAVKALDRAEGRRQRCRKPTA